MALWSLGIVPGWVAALPMAFCCGPPIVLIILILLMVSGSRSKESQGEDDGSYRQDDEPKDVIEGDYEVIE